MLEDTIKAEGEGEGESERDGGREEIEDRYVLQT